MDLSVLIVSYNTRELTLACLDSVYAQTERIEFEVLVVDNASQDGSAAAVAERFPQARLIRRESNIGFAAANNLASREARGEFLLLLNPDTVVLNGAIQRALEFARANSWASIVGGRTFFPTGRLNPNSCHGRPTPWSLLCMGTGVSRLFRRSRLFDPESLGPWLRDTVRRVDAVSGCFLLIPRALWEELHGFDESFFMYGEDTDLCLRAAQAGHACAICPQATLIHYGAASERVRPDKMVRLFRAKMQLIRKHSRASDVWKGAAGLRMWAFTRMTVTAALCRVRPEYAATHAAWREVWRRRSEFSPSSVC